MTTLSQAWHWAAAAVILGAAMPVIGGDVLVALHVIAALGPTAIGLP